MHFLKCEVKILIFFPVAALAVAPAVLQGRAAKFPPAVSYTHLDVYKRQGEFSRERQYRRISDVLTGLTQGGEQDA